ERMQDRLRLQRSGDARRQREEGVDLERDPQREKPDADLAEPVPAQRRPQAIGEPSDLTRADAEGEEERGDHGGRRERGVAPDVQKPLEPDDFVGEPGGPREEKEGGGRPVCRPPTPWTCRRGQGVACITAGRSELQAPTAP